jgi:hypothetical protein
LDYQEIIARRRALVVEPYKSLAEIGFDGAWVTPYQIISKSTEGPVLVALHWLDESSILRERDKLQRFGYLPNIRFNTVLDLALGYRGLSRSEHLRHPDLPSYSRKALRAYFACRNQAFFR